MNKEKLSRKMLVFSVVNLLSYVEFIIVAFCMRVHTRARAHTNTHAHTLSLFLWGGHSVLCWYSSRTVDWTIKKSGFDSQ
jgi:hypothetical protein